MTQINKHKFKNCNMSDNHEMSIQNTNESHTAATPEIHVSEPMSGSNKIRIPSTDLHLEFPKHVRYVKDGEEKVETLNTFSCVTDDEGKVDHFVFIDRVFTQDFVRVCDNVD